MAEIDRSMAGKSKERPVETTQDKTAQAQAAVHDQPVAEPAAAQAPQARAQTTKPKPPRVSTTDAQARVMKMADGGFRPAFNAPLAVDSATMIITGVELIASGSDMNQMLAMHQQHQDRYARVPEQWLADGGFAKLDHIERLDARATQVFTPVAAPRDTQRDRHARLPTDSQALGQWRERMGTEEAQANLPGPSRQHRVHQCAVAQPRLAALQRVRPVQGSGGAAVACAFSQSETQDGFELRIRSLRLRKRGPSGLALRPSGLVPTRTRPSAAPSGRIASSQPSAPHHRLVVSNPSAELKGSQTLRGCRRKHHLARYALIEADTHEVRDGGKDARQATRAAGGRKPSLNAEHVAALRAITREQPRSSLGEVTRELFRRTGVKVSTAHRAQGAARGRDRAAQADSPRR